MGVANGSVCQPEPRLVAAESDTGRNGPRFRFPVGSDWNAGGLWTEVCSEHLWGVMQLAPPALLTLSFGGWKEEAGGAAARDHRGQHTPKDPLWRSWGGRASEVRPFSYLAGEECWGDGSG